MESGPRMEPYKSSSKASDSPYNPTPEWKLEAVLDFNPFINTKSLSGSTFVFVTYAPIT